MQRSSESRMLIDGKLVPASDGATYDNVNPATEEVLGHVADATAADMDAAIGAARRAFDETDWSTNVALRVRCLRQLQAALEAEKEELRAELVAEVGTPVMITGIAQLEWPLSHALNYYAGLIEKYEWERELPESDLFGVHSVRRVWKEAVGVVGAIVAWNFPFEVLMGKLAPALAAGNTVVVKSAIETPFNALRIGRLITEATDIPPGVVNIVTTSDNRIAERLVRDPRVDMVSFTGSTAVGKHIQQIGAETVKRVFLELGGKSAMILLDDADFVQPTLFVDVDNAMSIAQQEIFGPVQTVIAYDDSKGDAEAVRIANDSPYGLSGAVFGSHERALAVARKLRTGTVGINGGMYYGSDAPYGGYKASGVGRQNGIEGLEQYLETKTIGYVGPE
jgi:acyl-CoA reductase-like NAD-dependent aldehyde dehydrogenase